MTTVTVDAPTQKSMVICKMILFRFHLNMMSPSNQLEAVLRYAFLHAFTPEQVCNIKKALQVYTQNSPFSLTFSNKWIEPTRECMEAGNLQAELSGE